MKRVLSLLLVVTFLFVFAACGKKPADTAPESETDSVWEMLTMEEHYDNMTVICDAVFLSGYADAEPQNRSTYKFDGDDVSADGQPVDRQTAEDLRVACQGVMLAVLAKNQYFACDEVTATATNYTYNSDVAYSANVMGYDTAFVVRNVTITLDSDGEISRFACEMEQAFTNNGEQMKYVLDVAFTFYDFGVTIVE